MSIHSTAVVDPKSKVHSSCEIGPYCLIGTGVELGEHCRLDSHVVIDGATQIGSHNHFFPFTSIGLAPQDITYAGEPTRLEIGAHNVIREFVTINRGTVKGGGCTRVGDHNLIMAYTHIAHDCHIGSHIIMANAATLGGHVTVEDWATVGALCPVHHFVRIGKYSFIGGGTTITRDVLPFSKTSAERGTRAYGLNAIGLERRGFSKGADPEDSPCVSGPAGVEAQYFTGDRKTEGGGRYWGGRRIAHRFHRILRTRSD